MIGKHENNLYYPEYCTQGSYYFNPEASEGEVVYIPEHQFDDNDFLSEGDEGMYTMNDLRTAAQTRLEDIEGYAELSDERKLRKWTDLCRGSLSGAVTEKRGAIPKPTLPNVT